MQIYLIRMAIFLIIVGILAFVVFAQIAEAFFANPFLNGLIIATLLIGVAYAFRQVLTLRPEVRWVNAFRESDPSYDADPPKLLAPMATLLRDRESRMAISTQVMRSILESIASRLDEARDISRYLIGLLVFLGLLGTFWGLLATVASVADTINALDAGTGDANVIFEDLKNGLQAPLSGMGTAFSSSLFGLAGSLILGFLDLQAGQAQNRFYTELEDWLSGVTDVTSETASGTALANARDGSGLNAIHESLRQLNQSMNNGGTSRNTTAAMADLAEGIQGLVQHMRTEQKTIREWVESQAEQQAELKMILKAIARNSRDGD